MTIDVRIKDGKGSNGSAQVIDRTDIGSGLITYTEPYRETTGQTKAAINTTYGADMNQNVSFGGTPDGIHNGTDSVLWTASAISGTWDFASTTVAQQGTKSIDATATVNNSEALLTRSSAISSGSYTAITGYIYITSWSTSGTKDVEVRLRLAGVDVGVPINLSTLIDTTTFNTWQTFTINLADITPSSSVDEMVIKTIDVGAGQPPDYYLDAIQLEETGSPAEFTISPDAGSLFTINTMTITMADAYVNTLTDSSTQKVPYNTLLGVAKLTSGINISLTTNEVVRFNSLFKQHIDFAAFPGTVTQSGGDGTNTWLTYTIDFAPGFKLDSRLGDILKVIINDDLSGLLYLRVLVRGSKEEII